MALICADLHLSTLRPSCRAESDWFAEQYRVLEELREIWDAARTVHGASEDLPFIIAGDVFDVASPSVSLVNMFDRWNTSLRGQLHVIPGQHDLRNHDIRALNDGGLGILQMHQFLCPINYRYPGNGRAEADYYHPSVGTDFHTIGYSPTPLRMIGFGWDQPIPEMEDLELKGDCTWLAIIHRYVHNGGTTAFTGADKSASAGKLAKQLPDFDFIFCGDNHTPFEYQKSKSSPMVVNCGALQCRTVKQIDFVPSVILLCEVEGKGNQTVLLPVRINLNVDGIQWAQPEVLKMLDKHESDLMDFRAIAAEVGEAAGGQTLRSMMSSFLRHIGKPEMEATLGRLLEVDDDQ